MKEIITYDKAEWHFNGKFPADLEEQHAYTHTAFFIGWLVNNNLVSDQFKEDFEDEIKEFKKQQLNPEKLYMILDGVFTSEEASEEGNAFTEYYFNKGKYVEDYENTLAKGCPSLYHVNSTWENFERMSNVISRRYFEFKNSN